MSTESQRPEHPDPFTWWKHIRQLAYTSMGALLAIGIAAVVDPERVSESSDVLQTLTWAFAAIIGSYVGGSVWDHIGTMRKPK